ncbi:hypothetical protein [Hyalangium rubrum]|uniref:Uncharacterized protein n=1 Tax=Hyalangium rubrum TaxID=3103134 RepID=A0ABU5GWT7_9BACT|nr:hypothetical protein [Hyalangium sp. s54d21]MDY7225551.1 hypothetical protein [Hyalangium sp. s54d21]
MSTETANADLSLLVLPPHRDATLAPEVPPGWRLVDIGHDFLRRISAPEAIAQAVEERATSPVTAQTMRELILLRTAQTLLERSKADGLAHLTALDAVLKALSGPPSGVRLQLDTLELESGTTERSTDVLRVAGRPVPYLEELALATERIAQAKRVRLWLVGPSQLPAAVWLARACPPTVALELAGPYAVAHRKVLGRLSVFQPATFPEDDAPLRWRVVPPGTAPGPESLVWIPAWLGLQVTSPPDERWDGIDWMQLERPYPRSAPGRPGGHSLGSALAADIRKFTGGAPWAGHVRFPSLYEVDALVESGCRLAVVGFCFIRHNGLLDLDGAQWPWNPLRDAMRRLREAGVRVVAEWWVGAPRIGEAELEATLRALEAEPLFDWVAGAHAFHAGAGRTHGDTGGWHLKWGDPPADFDLALSRRFDAPGTVPPTRLPDVLRSLQRRLLRQQPLSPGRVAGAYLHVPPARAPMPRPPPTEEVQAEGVLPAPPRPAWVRLDPDSVLVQLPASLEGAAVATWYVTNLRTGRMLAVDARLAPGLADLREPTRVEVAFAGLPAAERDAWLENLVGEYLESDTLPP